MRRFIWVGGAVAVMAGAAFFAFYTIMPLGIGNLKVTRIDDQTARLDRVIGSWSLGTVQSYLEDNPDTDTFLFGDMPGSMNDDANLELARFLATREMRFIIPADGQAHSGATDLFLSGGERIIECGGVYGVHSWADSSGLTAQDYPRDPEHEEHVAYVTYFEEMGLPDPAGFYFFTVDTPFEDIHEMTSDEINLYGITTVPMIC